ncbi:hypothetical protein E6R18_01480 [Streptomyces sp. A1277]|uniref:hypothetical protein n=1 Tax=Streptomyces sp. A1277 TaxID=2563103 RepID=UPI0010A23F0E|nr:hypothetical protein [Streptomyces sp. A1277]THA36061.1 hypothetical protein E6R18_01480 [Streptomyces sp. A1277]
MKKSVRLIGVALAGGALAFACVAQAVGAAPSVTRAGADKMPYAVEDFNYPGADKILAEQGLKLKRGDGHITLTDCGSDPDILRFIGRDRDDFCFRVTGPKGYLTLEVPNVTGVQTKDHTAHLEMTVDDDIETYDIAKNKWQGVGETTDPSQRDHVLVEITTGS